MASVIFGILYLSAHLKIQGNTSTLLSWLGKSDLPVATILAHAFLAASGIISGVGLAIAKIMESLFILLTSSLFSTQGALTQTNTSAQLKALLRVQSIFFGLIIGSIFIFSEFRSVLFFETIHLLSQTRISPTQYNLKSFNIAVHAAHSQLITTFISSFFFHTILSELISHARQTIAVPC